MKFSVPIVLALMAFISCGENKTRPDKEKFHLYLLMGQSNMAGRGQVEAIDTLTHPRVFMLSGDMNWVPARDPVHSDKPIAGTGLGLSFGKAMADRDSTVRIGLIPCAKGGSSINQWFRDSLHPETNSYPYNEMLAKAKKAMADGSLKGILWHQGESDTQSEISVREYAGKFYALRDSLYADLGVSSIPVVIGELGYFFYERESRAGEINRVLNQIAREDDCIVIVSAEGLNHKGDSIHFNAESYRELGRRYAVKMLALQQVCPPILTR